MKALPALGNQHFVPVPNLGPRRRRHLLSGGIKVDAIGVLGVVLLVCTLDARGAVEHVGAPAQRTRRDGVTHHLYPRQRRHDSCWFLGPDFLGPDLPFRTGVVFVMVWFVCSRGVVGGQEETRLKKETSDTEREMVVDRDFKFSVFESVAESRRHAPHGRSEWSTMTEPVLFHTLPRREEERERQRVTEREIAAGTRRQIQRTRAESGDEHVATQRRRRRHNT